MPLIIESLVRQLRSKNLKVRIAVMHALAQMAHTLHSKLDAFFPKMLPEFEKVMDETQGFDLVLDTLLILRRIFRGNGTFANYQQNHERILNIIKRALHHEYSKVVSEGLRVAGSFVYVLRAADASTIAPQFSQVVQPLFEMVREKLVKTDIDQEVKQCSIIAMANLVTVSHPALSKQQMAEIVGVYNDRL